MNKREFLKTSMFASGAMLVPSFLKGMEFLTPEQLSGFKNVVIIQLSGGNDGLNTLVPFRDDLYYRLNVIEIRLPPLRERKEDIPLLAHGLLQKSLAAQQKHIEGITDAALARLIDYPWPGNVRELENIVERAATLTQTSKIVLEDLPLNIRDIQGEGQFIEDAVEQILPLAQVEWSYIRRVLEKLGGNKYQTAHVLGIDRKTLYRKLSEMEEGKI